MHGLETKFDAKLKKKRDPNYPPVKRHGGFFMRLKRIFKGGE